MRTPEEHAQAAKRILGDETFILLMDGIDADIINSWRTSDSTEEREVFHAQQSALHLVRSTFELQAAEASY